MKKIILLIILMLTPVMVSANTKSYYIEANILENGDMEVRELKYLDGSYNGFSTTLKYQNTSLKDFTGAQDDFEGSNIYNAANITNLKVYSSNYTGNFSDIHKHNKEFTEVSFAQKGDYGLYTKDKLIDGVDLKIYMPSSYNYASLVTYTLKDVVVKHNDIAEIAWDFIGFNYEEDIDELIILVNLPKESNELRVFSHGPLNGTNKILNNSSVELVYPKLYARNAVDMRVVFDKEVVPTAIKKSNIDALSKILAIEEKRAEQANKERDIAKNQVRKEEMITRAIKYISIGWITGLICLIVYAYNKHDKEYSLNVNKYFREIPSKIDPSKVEYLMDKKITENSFSATILNLIRKKVLILSEIKPEAGSKIRKKKTDYLFKYNEAITIDSLGAEEKIIFDLLINVIGDTKEVKLNQIQDYSKKYTRAKEFMKKYNNWLTTSKNEAEQENYYEKKSGIKTTGILYCTFYLLLCSITKEVNRDFAGQFIFILASIAGIIYFIKLKKRSVLGATEYSKWNGLKNFLNDFGRFAEKEVPEIHLWEEYLVYATVFKIADKVQETMKIKLTNIDTNENFDYTYLNLNTYVFNTALNRAISDSIQTARQTISSHETASSTYSSGGGFGGGSSSGGGGFGGGGSGGGRF